MNLQQEIKDAKLKVKIAENKFNFASTQEEIDIAIQDIEAAEMRLDYLLKLAKKEE